MREIIIDTETTGLDPTGVHRVALTSSPRPSARDTVIITGPAPSPIL
jgi:hypothetical protein